MWDGKPVKQSGWTGVDEGVNGISLSAVIIVDHGGFENVYDVQILWIGYTSLWHGAELSRPYNEHGKLRFQQGCAKGRTEGPKIPNFNHSMHKNGSVLGKTTHRPMLLFLLTRILFSWPTIFWLINSLKLKLLFRSYMYAVSIWTISRHSCSRFL